MAFAELRFAAVLLAGLVASNSFADPIMTNAKSGRFREDRTFWFSVGEDERLRVKLDGSERYYGPGPVSVDLFAQEGATAAYIVQAERSPSPPEQSVLESVSFDVVIDKTAPSIPVISALPSASGWKLSFSSSAADERVDAVIDADGTLSRWSAVTGTRYVEARRIAGFAWAVDAAGNVSDLTKFSYEPFEIAIANPIPGLWANRQSLVVKASGAAEIFWNADGNDPLGPNGIAYTGPCLIDKIGVISVKVAARSPDGRIEWAETTYVATDEAKADTSALRSLELNGIGTEAAVTLPKAYSWKRMASSSVDKAAESVRVAEGGETLVLRAVAGVERYLPMELTSGSGTKARFLFSLRGAVWAKAVETDYGDFTEKQIAAGVATLYSVARLRLIGAPSEACRLLYADGVWRPFIEPVLVPEDGGVFYYLRESDERAKQLSVAFSPLRETMGYAAFPASAIADGAISAGEVVLTGGEGGSRFFLSARKPNQALTGAETVVLAELERDERLALDVCDGEELIWTVSALGGQQKAQWLIDRSVPETPVLAAPEEGSWLAMPVSVSALSSEGRIEGFIYEKTNDGVEREIPYHPSITLSGSLSGPAEYRVKLWVVDDAGNVGPSATRSFTVDATSVYVRSSPPFDTAVKADGSRAAPFPDLDSALSLAAQSQRKRVLVAGEVLLSAAVIVPEGVLIAGTQDGLWSSGSGQAKVRVASGAKFILSEGSTVFRDLRFIYEDEQTSPLFDLRNGALSLEKTSVNAKAGGGEALIVGKNSAITATDCELYGTGALIKTEGGVLTLTECYLVSETKARTTAILLDNTAAKITDTRVEAFGSVAVALDARGAQLKFDKAYILVKGASATALMASGVQFEANELSVQANGLHYGAGAVLRSVSGSWTKGAAAAAGRDAATLSFERDVAFRMEKVAVSVAADGVARGIQGSGGLPELHSCIFSFQGAAIDAADDAEALAGSEPKSASISDCVFRDFGFFWTGIPAPSGLDLFNRLYAPSQQANRWESDRVKR